MPGYNFTMPNLSLKKNANFTQTSSRYLLDTILVFLFLLTCKKYLKCYGQNALLAFDPQNITNTIMWSTDQIMKKMKSQKINPSRPDPGQREKN